MKIDHIEIKESHLSMPGFVGRKWALNIRSGGGEYTGYFDSLMGFMQACAEAIKYFGQVHGAITVDTEGTVRSTRHE